MIKRFIFIFVLMISVLSSYGFMNYENNRLVSYNTGKAVNIDFSDAEITSTGDEKPEIVEKLKELESELTENWAESVWMVVVPFISKGAYYEPPGMKTSFGTCVSMSPEDPAFKMEKYDLSAMGNYGIAKQNYDQESSYMDTNHHVIDAFNKADGLPLEIKKIFRTKNGEMRIVSYTAELIGTVPREDYAVLKINKVKIPTLPLGNLDAISDFQKKNGYPIAVIGSPYILEGTRSEGKIFWPSMNLAYNFYNLFNLTADTPLNEERSMTIADVNPGNSGGGAVGMTGENRGKILGKPCSGYPGSRINFSIPGHIIQDLFPRVLTGKIHYPCYTGLIMADAKTAMKDPLNAAFINKLGLKSLYFEAENMEGVLVVGFMEDSPLKTTTNPYLREQQADNPNSIKYGDIITAVNNEETKNPDEFLKKIRAITDEKIEIKVTRFASRPENGNEIWEKQEIIISKTKKELTLTDNDYHALYNKVRKYGFSALYKNAELRGTSVPFYTDLILK